MRTELVRRIRIAGLLLLAMAVAQSAKGQISGVPSPAASDVQKAAARDPLGRDTPRGCVVGFLRMTEREDYTHAVEYLEIKPSSKATDLARQLRKVLNAAGVVDIDRLSRAAEGDLNDGLPAGRERVGAVSIATGNIDILLHRVERKGSPAIWLFSPETLRQIPVALAEGETKDFEEYIPEALRDLRVFSIPLYRWVGTLLGICFALAGAALGSRLLFALVRPLVRRLTHEQDDRRLTPIRGPFWLLLLAIGFRALAGFSVNVLGRQFWIQSAVIIAVIGFTWLVIRFSDVAMGRAVRRLTKTPSSSKVAVLYLFHRLFKIGAAVAGAVVIVYAVGGDIKTILAGVGIGGLVIALAAQKTLENLFGGVALISDEPIRVGDFCRFVDKSGTVEDIGLRSTKVRTLDRSILSVPNGQLSLMTLENLTLRDKFLFKHNIGLRYETTPEQVRRVLEEVRELLRNHPNVDQETARVRLIGLGDSALTVEVFSYLRETDYNAFLETQEQLLMSILDIVVAAGSGLAYPSHALYLNRQQPQDPALAEQAAARIRQQIGSSTLNAS